MLTFAGFLTVNIAITIFCSSSANVIEYNTAPIGSLPFQVSVRVYGTHQCAGSIINKRYVLTAAQCIYFVKRLPDITVHFGTNFLNETGVIYDAEAIIFHSDLFGHNVGIIRTDRIIQYTGKIGPVRIAVLDFVDVGFPAFVVGWTKINGTLSNALQMRPVTIVPEEECSRIYGLMEPGLHFCTYSKSVQEMDSRDAGSPLIANATQIGILIRTKVYTTGVYELFAKIFANRDWIGQNSIAFV